MLYIAEEYEQRTTLKFIVCIFCPSVTPDKTKKLAQALPEREPILALTSMGKDSFDTMQAVLSMKGFRITPRGEWGFSSHFPDDDMEGQLPVDFRERLTPARVKDDLHGYWCAAHHSVIATLVAAVQYRYQTLSMHDVFAYGDTLPSVYVCLPSGLAEFFPRPPHHKWLAEGEHYTLQLEISRDEGVLYTEV